MRTGPLELSSRALGRDLARGFMLLFIALANTHYFLRAPQVLGGYPQDGSPADRSVIWLLATFVDGRAFPGRSPSWSPTGCAPPDGAAPSRP